VRPEEYANAHLMEFRRLTGRSEEEVHDARVEIRKYVVVGKALYRLHGDWESLDRAFRIARTLGKVRDVDVSGCPGDRDRLLYSVEVMRDHVMPFPRLLGSRLLVMESLVREYRSVLVEEEFHSLRKRLRRARILVESLEMDSEEIKELVRRMGDLRDQWLRSRCSGEEFQISGEDTREFKEQGVEILRDLLSSGHEFHHLRKVLQSGQVL